MQINNSSVNPLSFSPVSEKVKQTDNKTLVNNQREQARAKEDNSQPKKSTRFDVDQQALTQVALFSEQRSNEQKASNINSISGGYDQPSQQNQFAVNSYRTVENIAQRESIQQTFGVDLFV